AVQVDGLSWPLPATVLARGFDRVGKVARGRSVMSSPAAGDFAHPTTLTETQALSVPQPTLAPGDSTSAGSSRAMRAGSAAPRPPVLQASVACGRRRRPVVRCQFARRSAGGADGSAPLHVLQEYPAPRTSRDFAVKR